MISRTEGMLTMGQRMPNGAVAKDTHYPRVLYLTPEEARKGGETRPRSARIDARRFTITPLSS
jgi:hypothetical protein